MNRISAHLCTAAAALVLLTGCSAYRVSSNVEVPPQPSKEASAPAAPASDEILLLEGNLTDRKYKELGPIEVSVKKLTLFHKDPTREQADAALRERARIMGADAVINIIYKSGIGFTTWGYMDAEGTAVKFLP